MSALNRHRHSPPAAAPSPALKRWVIPALAIVCGVGVSNTYFPQALPAAIATGLHVSRAHATLVVTATQLGYAAGIFLLVPLGDRIAHRRLTVVLTLGAAGGLLVAGTASSLPVLATAGVEIGLTTVVAQVVIPMTMGLVSADRRGTVAGQLVSGIVAGILLARSFGGLIGALVGWRAPYLIAAAMALISAGILRICVPASAPRTADGYIDLLRETLLLFRTQPAMRRSCFYQSLVFGGFIAAWTSVALLMAGPRYRLGTGGVGLVALIGLATIFAAPIAGRWIDRSGPDVVSRACMIGTILAAVILVGADLGGPAGWIFLICGMLMLDSSTHCSSTACQARVLALIPEKRSRLNSGYMTCVFLGGTVGSFLGAQAYEALGWPGTCGLIALAGTAALGRDAVWRRTLDAESPTDPESPARRYGKLATAPPS